MTIELYRREKWLFALFCVAFLAAGLHLARTFFVAHSVPAPDYGGSYDEGITGSLSGGNPIFAFTNTGDADVARLIYSGLTRYDPLTERFVPDLATYERDESRTQYTFVLREGATWHDGTPVTADDVLFTYTKILQNPEVGVQRLLAAYENSRVEKINERTIRITLKEPYVFFSSLTTFPILPKHLWEHVAPKDIVSTPLSDLHVGSGPYRFERLRASEDGSSVTAVLAAFEKYYGQKPYLETLNMTVYKDSELLRSNMSGLDAANNVPLATLSEGETRGFKTLTYTLPQYVAVFLNTSSSKLTDRNVRLGLLLATDKQEILKSVLDAKRIDTPFLEDKSDYWIYKTDRKSANGALHGANWRYPTPTPIPTATPVAPAVPGAPSPQPSPAPTTPPTPTPTPSPTPTPIPTPSPTPTSQDGSLPPVPHPIRTNPQGEPLKLELLTADVPQAYVDIAGTLREQYREVGVDLTVTVLPPEQLQQRIRAKTYDLLLYGQSLDYNLDTYPFWHSSQEGKNGLNLSNLTSGTADRLLAQIRNPFATTNDEAVAMQRRQDAERRLEALFDDQVPAIFLYQPLYYYHYRDGAVKGLEMKNMRAFSDRLAFLALSYRAEKHVLSEPFSIFTFLRWALGWEATGGDEASPSVSPG